MRLVFLKPEGSPRADTLILAECVPSWSCFSISAAAATQHVWLVCCCVSICSESDGFGFTCIRCYVALSRGNGPIRAGLGPLGILDLCYSC